jgi:L-lactate dehydrogenase (cytochrome)
LTDLNGYLSVADLARAARRRLPRCVAAYVDNGAEDESGLLENRRAFDRVGLVPRALRDVSRRTHALELWGRTYAMPVGIAPTGMAGMVRFEADLALAAAAHDARVPFVISGSSNVPLERLAADGRRCWYQAYLPSDRGRIDRLLLRLEAAGIEVLVVTVDACVGGNRENMVRAGFDIPFRLTPRLVVDGLLHPRWTVGVFGRTLLRSGVPRFANLFDTIGPPITEVPAQALRTGRDALDWNDLAWLRDRWQGRLIIKGLMNPADARLAQAHRVDAIIVSNHGGRQLDGTIAPLQALPAIVESVPGLPVFLDGGVRRGTDVLKALALGARMVFVGRAPLYGVAVAGQAGVKRALDILMAEIDRNLALIGCASLEEVGSERVEGIPGTSASGGSGATGR